MIETILKKCLAELEADSPNIAYVRGMLETLIAFQPGTKESTDTVTVTKVIPTILPPTGTVPITGHPPVPPLAVVKKLAEESQEL